MTCIIFNQSWNWNPWISFRWRKWRTVGRDRRKTQIWRIWWNVRCGRTFWWNENTNFTSWDECSTTGIFWLRLLTFWKTSCWLGRFGSTFSFRMVNLEDSHGSSDIWWYSIHILFSLTGKIVLHFELVKIPRHNVPSTRTMLPMQFFFLIKKQNGAGFKMIESKSIIDLEHWNSNLKPNRRPWRFF